MVAIMNVNAEFIEALAVPGLYIILSEAARQVRWPCALAAKRAYEQARSWPWPALEPSARKFYIIVEA
ncbi:MAG TPA: hypothetical protein VMW71_00455 [Thermoplasmata archaeon]|nr:hypothetical protein [Thermoplasmata archaeon]